MKTPSREQIAVVLLTVLDGRDIHDLQGWTGLPEEECSRIEETIAELRVEFPDWYDKSIL